MERRRALRPFLRVGLRLRPELAFLGRRLTPGGLGLELTTLLAALSVGLFVLIAYWTVVAGDPGPTPGDQTALDVSDDIQVSWLDHAAKAFTQLGSVWIAFPIAALAAVALGAARRWMELIALAIGMALVFGLVQEIKVWTDRPRPPDGLVSTEGSSFPSAHAAYSTVYAWIAVTAAFRVVPGITRRSVVIAAAIVLAALIGLTRAYLRVHWLSDVTAGWALGLSVFSAVAVAVLVVAHIRDNPRRNERDRQRVPDTGAGVGD